VLGTGACGVCSAWLPPPRDPAWTSDDDRLAAVLITTGANLEPTHEIVEWRGLVFGEALVGGSTLVDLRHGLGGPVGEEWASLKQELEAGREQAMAQMRAACVAGGGNAIVAVQVGYEELARTSLLVSAQGTAVVAALSAGFVVEQPVTHGRSW
jgi:uncharacterized protein YbjQ (UPF0145 family)